MNLLINYASPPQCELYNHTVEDASMLATLPILIVDVLISDVLMAYYATSPTQRLWLRYREARFIVFDSGPAFTTTECARSDDTAINSAFHFKETVLLRELIP